MDCWGRRIDIELINHTVDNNNMKRILLCLEATRLTAHIRTLQSRSLTWAAKVCTDRVLVLLTIVSIHGVKTADKKYVWWWMEVQARQSWVVAEHRSHPV
jgi:membrane-bound inhibitor of C-type lysozyme